MDRGPLVVEPAVSIRGAGPLSLRGAGNSGGGTRLELVVCFFKAGAASSILCGVKGHLK